MDIKWIRPKINNMRYKVIDLKNIGNCEDTVETFESEKDAVIYLRGMARALSLTDYKIISIPTTCGVSYDNPQYLVAYKYLNSDDENTEKDEVRYALMSVEKNEKLIVEKEISMAWGKENIEYSISRRDIEELKDFSKQGFVFKEKNNIKSYVRKDKNFVNEIYEI